MESNYTKVGSLQRSFGTEGFLRYKVFPDYKQDLKDSTFLFIQHDDYYVPYRIVELRAEKRLIQFDDILDQEKASSIHNMDIYLRGEDVIAEEDDQSDFLIGYKLYDDQEYVAEIIEVKSIAGYLYGVLLFQEKEVLIPLNEELILELNPEARIIRMELPEGILTL